MRADWGWRRTRWRRRRECPHVGRGAVDDATRGGGAGDSKHRCRYGGRRRWVGSSPAAGVTAMDAAIAAFPSDWQQRRLRRGPKRINVAVEDSLLFDSSMLLIKASSEGAGVHNNSCGLFIIFNQPSLSFFWSHCISASPNVESIVSQGQEWLHKNRKIWIHMSYEFIFHMNSYAEITAYLWQHCLWTWCISNFKSEHYEHTKVHVSFRNWVWILLGLLGMIMDQRRPPVRPSCATTNATSTTMQKQRQRRAMKQRRSSYITYYYESGNGWERTS